MWLISLVICEVPPPPEKKVAQQTSRGNTTLLYPTVARFAQMTDAVFNFATTINQPQSTQYQPVLQNSCIMPMNNLF